MLRAVTQDLLLLHDVDPDVVLDALPASADGGGVIKNIFQNSVPPKLENQLEALNSTQCLNWLVPEMRTALGEEGKSNAYRLSWGNEDFRPSFWKGELERIAPWNLVESPTNHTNSIFGVPFVEVMKLAIRFRLEQKGLHPSTHVQEDRDISKEQKKLKYRPKNKIAAAYTK